MEESSGVTVTLSSLAFSPSPSPSASSVVVEPPSSLRESPSLSFSSSPSESVTKNMNLWKVHYVDLRNLICNVSCVSCVIAFSFDMCSATFDFTTRWAMQKRASINDGGKGVSGNAWGLGCWVKMLPRKGGVKIPKIFANWGNVRPMRCYINFGMRFDAKWPWYAECGCFPHVTCHSQQNFTRIA